MARKPAKKGSTKNAAKGPTIYKGLAGVTVDTTSVSKVIRRPTR